MWEIGPNAKEAIEVVVMCAVCCVITWAFARKM